jgi:hypothetical protein
MAQVVANHRNIDTRLEKRDGATVAHDVRRNIPFS